MRNTNRTFADSVIDHHQASRMAASTLTKEDISASPSAIKSATQLPRLDLPTEEAGGAM